mgnify:CR=1 FL=1
MIGVLAHTEKAGARNALKVLVRELRRAGICFGLERATAALLGRTGGMPERELIRSSELLVVLGGDGTLLRLARRLGRNPPPLFGINAGSLGFLTCAGAEEIPHAVACLREKKYILSARNTLRVTLTRPHAKPMEVFALNDAVLGRGQHSELIHVEVSIDGTLLAEYNADGLIVATSTGSTAYSLAAGGPILTPDSGAFVITPICPHVLTNRSLVVSDRSVITARNSRVGKEVFLTVDGQKSVAIQDKDILTLAKGDRELLLAMLPGRQFPAILRHKLKWMEGNIPL